jgi:signal peptidase II
MNPNTPSCSAASRPRGDLALFLALAAATTLADQASKLMVVLTCPLNFHASVLPGFFSLVHWHNPGAAWGKFSDYPQVLAAVSAAVLLGLIVFHRHLSEGCRWRLRALALVAGGIYGNLLDRLFHGAVIDFLFFHVGRFSWPAFNVADSAISIGVALYVIRSFFPGHASDAARPAAEASGERPARDGA